MDCLSFWEGLVCVDNPNAVVSEFVVHLWDVHFLHMAGDAILRTGRARLSGATRGLFPAGLCDVTTGTDPVVS